MMDADRLDELWQVAEAAAKSWPRLPGSDPYITTFDPPTVLDLLAAAARTEAAETKAEQVRAFDPCQGGDEQHERHLAVCVPFYAARDAALDGVAAEDSAPATHEQKRAVLLRHAYGEEEAERILARDRVHTFTEAEMAEHDARVRRNDKAVQDSLLRFAQHLVSTALPMRCELTSQRGYEKCGGESVAIRWEDGFADTVCQRHADDAVERGALVVFPKRHNGETYAEAVETDGR